MSTNTELTPKDISEAERFLRRLGMLAFRYGPAIAVGLLAVVLLIGCKSSSAGGDESLSAQFPEVHHWWK